MSDPHGEKQKFHFIGVCGTAMGAVAAGMKARGFAVSGSDANVYPPMSTFLEERGVEIIEGFAAENIPEDADVIVVGNAISRGNPEAEEVLRRKLLYTSLPEILKQHFLRGKSNLVVTGTHGKTTTATILTWLLIHADRDPGYMIGGIPKNFPGGATFTESPFIVLEGDEYDTAFFDKRSKFLHYLPEVVIMNNIEFDHADIYDSLDQILLTFSRLLRVVPDDGLVLINGDDPNCLKASEQCFSPMKKIGLGEECDARIEDIEYNGGSATFTFAGERYDFPMDGEFNVRNACMAIATATHAGLSPDEIRGGLSTFEGVKRRQELRGEAGGIKVIDDFGHHPTAISQAVEALKRTYPSGRLWAVFEPRSNTTKRNIFQDDLVAALSKAEGAVVAAVAGQEKIAEGERLDAAKLVADVNANGTEAYHEPSVDAIVERLGEVAKDGDVVAVFSNGGFDNIHNRLLEKFAG